MRVLLVAINYDPEPTGIAPYVTGLARGLLAAGHQPHVLTGIPHYPQWRNHTGFTGLRRYEIIDGVPVTRVRHVVPAGGIGLGRIAMEVSFGLGAIAVPWGEPDVVITVSPPLIASAAVLARARLTRLSKSRRSPATAVWSQDLYTRGLAELDSHGSWKAGLGKAVEGAVYRAADGVVAIGERFKAFAVSELGVDRDDVEVHRNWSHVTSGGPAEAARLRTQMGWGRRTVVLHAGSMGNKQGLEVVVEAAKLAEREHSPVLFVLTGDGSERPRMERLAGDCANIRFVDPLPDTDFAAALSAADVLLVNEKPGVAEMAIPSKLTTYFEAGKPVLAAVYPGGNTAALVDAAGAGRVVAPGDPRVLLDEATVLAGDADRARRYGESARAYASANMASGDAVRGIIDFLAQLAGEHTVTATSTAAGTSASTATPVTPAPAVTTATATTSDTGPAAVAVGER